MNEDGSFTCTTELTTFGQTMLALNLNKDVKNAGVPSKTGDESDGTIDIDGIRDYIEKAFTGENLADEIAGLTNDEDDKANLDKRSIALGDFVKLKTPIVSTGAAALDVAAIATSYVTGLFADQSSDNQGAGYSDVYYCNTN